MAARVEFQSGLSEQIIHLCRLVALLAIGFVEAGDLFHVLVVEFEIENIDIGSDPLSMGGFGDDDSPACKCQRIIACAGLFPCFFAISAMAGLSSTAPLPSGL